MTTRHRLAAAGALALAATLLAGCSDEPDPADPSPAASASAASGPATSPAPTTSPSLQDRSGEVVGAATPLAPIATTKAKATSSYEGSTFEIHALRRTDASTLLVWRVVGGTEYASHSDANVRAWEKYPVIVVGGREYSVVTFDKQVDGWSALSDPALKVPSGAPAAPQYALYPPLPAGTTQATLRGPWFDDVTVPVTDAG